MLNRLGLLPSSSVFHLGLRCQVRSAVVGFEFCGWNVVNE